MPRGLGRPARLYAGYAFDLDGTLYLGETALPGAVETVAAVRRAGARVVFLSNNPLRTREEYAAKLTRLGIPAAPEDVINSSFVLVRYLSAVAPGASLLVIGEASVQAELRAAGFALTEDPRRANYLVACFDRTFDYRKLKLGFDALRAGARFVATNRDAYCPTPDGGLPDCGAIIAALEACTGRQVETVVGKPSPITGQVLLERLGTAPADALMVGDRLETDVALGVAVGMATAVVLTGVTTREAALAARPRPDYILDSVAQVLPEAQG